MVGNGEGQKVPTCPQERPLPGSLRAARWVPSHQPNPAKTCFTAPVQGSHLIFSFSVSLLNLYP